MKKGDFRVRTLQLSFGVTQVSLQIHTTQCPPFLTTVLPDFHTSYYKALIPNIWLGNILD